MRNFQNKNRWKHILESKLVLIILGVFILVFAWGVFGFVRKMQETSLNRKIAEDKMAELVKSKEKLTTDIAKLKTESGIEESIRDKFGLAKDGEGMIVVVEGRNSPIAPVDSEQDGFFSFFWNWLK